MALRKATFRPLRNPTSDPDGDSHDDVLLSVLFLETPVRMVDFCAGDCRVPNVSAEGLMDERIALKSECILIVWHLSPSFHLTRNLPERCQTYLKPILLDVSFRER